MQGIMLPWMQSYAESPGGYLAKVAALTGSNLVAHWPGDEASGTIARCVNNAALNGVYSGVTLGQAGIGDGRTCPLYDGVNDFTNVYSAALAAAFNAPAGTFFSWAKTSAAGIWTDGTNRYICSFRADISNRLYVARSTANNTFDFGYVAGGTSELIQTSSFGGSVAWLALAITWDINAGASGEMKAFGCVQGSALAQIGTTQVSLGTWSGALASTVSTIGASSTGGSLVWSGNIAHAVLCNTALPLATIAQLATV